MVCDALADKESAIRSRTALEVVLIRRDVTRIVDTLNGVGNHLINEIVARSPDVAVGTMGDAVAMMVLGMGWSSPEKVAVGRALLQRELAGGEIEELDDEALVALAKTSPATILIIWAQLVIGMSILIAKGEGVEGGDPIRRLIEEKA